MLKADGSGESSGGFGAEAEKHEEAGGFGGTMGQVGRGEDTDVQSEREEKEESPLC